MQLYTNIDADALEWLIRCVCRWFGSYMWKKLTNASAIFTGPPVQTADCAWAHKLKCIDELSIEAFAELTEVSGQNLQRSQAANAKSMSVISSTACMVMHACCCFAAHHHCVVSRVLDHDM